MATYNPLGGLAPSSSFPSGSFPSSCFPPIITHFIATSSPADVKVDDHRAGKRQEEEEEVDGRRAGKRQEEEEEVDGRRAGKRQEEEEAGFKIEYSGAGGYVYSVKYVDGKIVLGVNGTGVDEWGVSGAHAMSIKNWKLFRTVVCHDLDQTGFPDILYVSQWLSPTGPEMYRVDADRYNRNAEEFICLSVCEDREPVIANRGVENWMINSYPLNLEERFSWFKDLFFIQWSDWKPLLRVFCEVDNAIKRDKLSNAYESVRRRLVFDDLALAQKTYPTRTLCRPKIIQNSDC